MDEWVKALFDELRSRIDAIDHNMVHLLEERMQVVTKISELKARHGIAVLDAGREKIVLDNIRNAVRDDAYEAYLLQVFEGIMAASRAYQQQRLAGAAGGGDMAKPFHARNPKHRLGLLGAKLSHSHSPEIHELWFRLHDVSGTYELLERTPDELSTLLPQLEERGFHGLNVTIPYKTHMMRHLDEVSPEAARIGAVNTIVLGERKLGYNTDYAGFGHLVRSVMPHDAQKVAVLGTGGSSRAVLAWLQDHGAQEIILVSRDPEESALKWPGYPIHTYDAFKAAGMDLVVNTTPVGMFPNPDASPLTAEQLKGAGCVVDLIYNPAETLLMSQAKAQGIPTANGLLMLVAQAVEAQAIWQGIAYEETVTAAILRAMTGQGDLS